MNRKSFELILNNTINEYLKNLDNHVLEIHTALSTRGIPSGLITLLEQAIKEEERHKKAKITKKVIKLQRQDDEEALNELENNNLQDMCKQVNTLIMQHTDKLVKATSELEQGLRMKYFLDSL